MFSLNRPTIFFSHTLSFCPALRKHAYAIYSDIYDNRKGDIFLIFVYMCVCTYDHFLMHLRLTFGSGVQQIEMIRNSPIFFGMLVETQAY